MKVFLVGDFPEHGKTQGGVQGVLVNLANGLIAHPEVEPVLVSLSDTIGHSHFEQVCKSHCLGFRSSFLKARQKFDALVTAEKPDIVHLQGVVPGILLFRKKYRKYFVVTQHAILNEERQLQVSLRRKLLFWIKERIENYYFSKIGNIIFISAYNQKVFFEGNRDRKDIVFERIANPVNRIFFQGDAPDAGQINKELYFVGEVKKRKGLHVLLRALHLLEQRGIRCKVHVIGGFKETQYEKFIKDLVEELDLSDQTVFCGWKNQEEVIAYARDIPIFVLPSFQETLPLSIAEALCRGKIVIATDTCGIPEMITDGESGFLFPTGDFRALAKVLEDLFKNKTELTAISQNAKRASEKYRPENVVRETLAFYRRVRNDAPQ